MEVSIVQYLVQHRIGWLDNIFVLLSNTIFLFALLFLVIVVIFIVDKKKSLVLSVFLFAGLAIYSLINEITIKQLFYRERPYLALDLPGLGHLVTDSSFPSGHTASVTAIVVILGMYNKKNYYWGIPMIVLVGFSRVYNGLHWPTDVLFGVIAGIIYALIAKRAVKTIFKDEAKFLG